MQNKKLLLITAVFAILSLHGSEEKGNVIELYSCKGENVQCDYNLISPSASFNYDTTGLDFTSLGILNGDLITTLKFPQAGEKVLYSFVPTTGFNPKPSSNPGQGEIVAFMIVSFEIDNIRVTGTSGMTVHEVDLIKKEAAHAKKQFKSWVNYMYKIYQQFSKQQQWTEVATIFSQKPITSQMIKLKTDGTMLIANKKEGEEEILKSEKLGAFKSIYINQY